MEKREAVHLDGDIISVVSNFEGVLTQTDLASLNLNK